MKQAMGSRAAYAEAVRRWGSRAWIMLDKSGCKIGVLQAGLRWGKGSGKTWTLADADRRAGKKGEPHAPKPV